MTILLWEMLFHCLNADWVPLKCSLVFLLSLENLFGRGFPYKTSFASNLITSTNVVGQKITQSTRRVGARSFPPSDDVVAMWYG